MGTPQKQHPDQARPPGSACVWVVAALLLLCLLAGGGCLVLYLALPPADAPQWLAPAGLSLVALPWAFWTVTCAYRCCCSSADASSSSSSSTPTPATSAFAERQPSSRKSAVAPLPSSKNLKSALASVSSVSARRDWSTATGSPTTSGGGTRRVRFGEATVLGEDHAAEKDDDGGGGGSSVHSNESEAPLAASMQSSS
ncbi:hypothetical protein EJB05_02545, partial [Eragrostis curvula]